MYTLRRTKNGFEVYDKNKKPVTTNGDTMKCTYIIGGMTGETINVHNLVDKPEVDINKVLAELSHKHGKKTEMDNLIGLGSVKKELNELTALMEVQKMRKTRGFSTENPNLHLMFTGNPGTGKTTVAKILGKIYKDIGILRTGKVNAVNPRVHLIAKYLGQTGSQMQQAINDSMGGILFIDEAYTLFAKESPWDYGKEAIGVLIDNMESRRDDFMVIMAGYQEEMNDLLDSNSGLKSRLSNIIEFPDYSKGEMLLIFRKMMMDRGYSFDETVEKKVGEILMKEKSESGGKFGNARNVRNLVERAEKRQSMRLKERMMLSTSSLTDKELQTFISSDIL